MVVGTLRLCVRLHGCRSLKEKRRARRSLIDRIRNRHRVAVAEVDTQDVWTLLTIGVAAIGPDRGPVEQVLMAVANQVADSGQGELIDEDLQVDHL